MKCNILYYITNIKRRGDIILKTEQYNLMASTPRPILGVEWVE